MQNGGIRQIQFTVSPALDTALHKDWEEFSRAAMSAGEETLGKWFAARLGRPEIAADLTGQVADLISVDVEQMAIAAVELAELAEVTDDALAEMLWDGAYNAGVTSGDGDLVFEATTRLASIAEEDGDAMAVAEYFLRFLNWRRQPGNGSDPDAVFDAFDGVIRAAELDGRPSEAARFAFLQGRYGRIVEAESELASVGNWDPNESPFNVWSD